MFIKNFFSGLNAYLKAHRLIKKHQLWKYMAIPAIFSLLYIIILGTTTYFWGGDVSNYFYTHWFGVYFKHPAVEIISGILVWLFIFFMVFISYKQLTLIIFAPFLSQLSETTEKILYGEVTLPFSWKGFFDDVLRSAFINLRYLAMSLIWSFLAWVFIFIPGIGIFIALPLLFIVQAFYVGCGLIDNVLERKKYTIRESIAFGRKYRWINSGIGTGFSLILFIPILGWMVAPIYGIVAGTISTLEVFKKEQNI